MTDVVQFKNFSTSLNAVDLGRERFDWVRLKEDLSGELGQVYPQEVKDDGTIYLLGPVMLAATVVIGLILTIIIFS